MPQIEVVVKPELYGMDLVRSLLVLLQSKLCQVITSTLTKNIKQGIELAGNEFGSWDLGTTQHPGGQTLQDNSSWQLYDNRVANTGITITAQGNTIGSSSSTPTGTQTAGPWRGTEYF